MKTLLVVIALTLTNLLSVTSFSAEVTLDKPFFFNSEHELGDYIGFHDGYLIFGHDQGVRKCTEMSFSRVSEKTKNIEQFVQPKMIENKIDFGLIALEMKAGFIYEVYTSNPYKKNMSYLLVKRDPSSFKIIESTSWEREYKDASMSYNVHAHDEVFIDTEGVFIYDSDIGELSRFNANLELQWRESININQSGDSYQFIMNDMNESLILARFVNIEDNEEKKLLDNLKFNFVSNNQKFVYVISVINKNGEIKTFAPKIESSFTVGKFNAYVNGNTITTIFHHNGSPGCRFYKWSLESEEILIYKYHLLKPDQLVNEEVLSFASLISGVKDTINRVKYLSRFEFCQELKNDEGYVICHNTREYIRKLYDLSLSYSDYKRCNVLFNIDKNGNVKWIQPNIFGSLELSSNNLKLFNDYSFTYDDKLISISTGFVQNFTNNEYKLVHAEPYRGIESKLSKSFTSIISIRDLQTGVLQSVNDLKERFIPNQYETVHDNISWKTVGILVGIKSKKPPYRYGFISYTED